MAAALIAEREMSDISSTGADESVETDYKAMAPMETIKSAKEENEKKKDTKMEELAVERPRQSMGAPSMAMDGGPPMRRPAVNYPLMYVAPTGTISVLLHQDVIVEIAVDKAIRVVCNEKFAVSFPRDYCRPTVPFEAASNGRGTSSCILHHDARIYQQDTKVYSSFGEYALHFGSSITALQWGTRRRCSVRRECCSR
jgi:hypothetical protein